MTLDEVADRISQGLPDWQRDANLEWLREIHATLKTGGTWMYPNEGSIWEKTEEGFDCKADVEQLRDVEELDSLF
jgi:hypothetical protein